MSEDAEGFGQAGDEAMARRLRALACTAPLHHLDARKTRLDWVDAADYQMAEIALQAIDQVTIAMDFDRGAGQEQVVRRLVGFIAAQCPGRADEEYRQVGHWVLENLINVGSLDRGFRAVYGTLGPGGGYERRHFDFKLLVELVGPDGEVYLRATDEAINVLVGALDTDVESAQIAAEVKLENLVRRGRLGDARLAAEQARYRTVQYAELLRRQLDATRRDVRSVDWLATVPDLIEEALSHIEARYRAENAIMTNIANTRDEATDADRRRRAAELIGIVADCIRRHTQLQARLQEAGATFRAEQDRQQFAGTPQRAAIDLFGQLLTPCLGLDIGTASGPTSTFFTACAGLRLPSVVSLGGLVETLLLPPLDRDPLGEEIPEPELAPLPNQDRFTDEQWRAADALLEVEDAPRRLSGLLAQARQTHPELPDLVVLRVLHAVGPLVASARGQGDAAVPLAVSDGTVLDDPEFGGQDLLVTMARLVAGPVGTGQDAHQDVDDDEVGDEVDDEVGDDEEEVA